VRLELGHKPAVGKAVLPRRRVDLNIPKSTEIAFFLAPMNEHIQEGVRGRFLHPRNFGISSRTESFGVFSQVFSSFIGGYASFDSWHDK